METELNARLSLIERTVRIGAGALFLAATLSGNGPAWMALVATYPLFTAMLARDPFYALMAAASRHHGGRPGAFPTGPAKAH